MKAPVTAILAMDLSFYEDLPKNFPAMDVSFLFKDNLDVFKKDDILQVVDLAAIFIIFMILNIMDKMVIIAKIYF